MAFLLRSMGLATAIMGDPAALSPRSWGSYHASSTCIATARRPQGVSITFSRRLYNKQNKIFGNFQMIIAYSYCKINIWCSISKFCISSAMMMNTKYSDENDVVVVRTPWNRLCKCYHFRGVFTTRVLRVYYVYGVVTTLGSRPSRPHRVLCQIAEPWRLFWACSKQTPWLGDHGDHSTMAGVSTTFIPRLWRPWRALRPFSVTVEVQSGSIHTKDARCFCCGNSAADLSNPHTFQWGTLTEDVFPSANFTLPPKPRPPTGPI